MATELQAPSIEFHVVDGEEARALDPAHLDWPADSKVVFAIEQDQVVGRSSMFIMPMIGILNADFIEGTWVRPDKQGTSLAYRLVKKVEELFIEHGKTHMMAFVYDEQPEVGAYLERVGFVKRPLTMYQKQLVKE